MSPGHKAVGQQYIKDSALFLSRMHASADGCIQLLLPVIMLIGGGCVEKPLADEEYHVGLLVPAAFFSREP